MLQIYLLQATMSLSGWVCVVTGASRGIGRGIALQLSEAGATVYITGRQEKTLKQTAAEVNFKNVFFLNEIRLLCKPSFCTILVSTLYFSDALNYNVGD